MNYKIFKSSLVGEFLDKLNQEEADFVKLYENQEEFLYPFEESDILESNISVHNENLGEEMLQTLSDNQNDNQAADFECAKILYENLKLTPTQAGNADFWNYLHHFDMYKYIHQRWKNQGDIHTHIKRHWLLNLTSQKHLINFPLTTLWWSIHLTIDETREDKYELSKVYFSNNRFRTVSLGGMSFVRHKPAILSVLEFMKNYREELTRITNYTDLGDEVSKFINLLGGTKPLSFFDQDWFTEKLEERFRIESKLSPSNSEIERLERNNKVLEDSLLKLKEELDLEKSIKTTTEDIQFKLIEEIIKKGVFGVRECKYLINEYEHSGYEVQQNILNLIGAFLTRNNLFDDKRANESFKLLKKTFSRTIIYPSFKEVTAIKDKHRVSTTPKNENIEINDVKRLSYEKIEEKIHGYFCLNNKDNPNYMVSDVKRDDFDYCIEINGVNRSGYLLHFYAEGKIKKTKIDSVLLDRNRNQMYSNGKCNNLNLVGVKIISDNVLFGIAYSKNGITKFKAMDESDTSIFRNDNNSLHQEGKKILYSKNYEKIQYKILPYFIKDDLGTLVQGPSGNGANIINNYHSDKWIVLKKFWPILFNREQNELNLDE